MKEPVLKAVAEPPRLFLAPFILGVFNLGIQFALMFMFMAMFNWYSPLYSIPFILGIHLLLVGLGAREPHLSTMILAAGPFLGASRQVVKSSGHRLSP